MHADNTNNPQRVLFTVKDGGSDIPYSLTWGETVCPLSTRAARYTEFSRLSGDQGQVPGHVCQNIYERQFFVIERF